MRTLGIITFISLLTINAFSEESPKINLNKFCRQGSGAADLDGAAITMECRSLEQPNMYFIILRGNVGRMGPQMLRSVSTHNGKCVYNEFKNLEVKNRKLVVTQVLENGIKATYTLLRNGNESEISGEYTDGSKDNEKLDCDYF